MRDGPLVDEQQVDGGEPDLGDPRAELGQWDVRVAPSSDGLDDAALGGGRRAGAWKHESQRRGPGCLDGLAARKVGIVAQLPVESSSLRERANRVEAQATRYSGGDSNE